MTHKKKPKAIPLNLKRGYIDMSHGAGGKASAQLIDQLFLPAFNNPWLAEKSDQACFTTQTGRMVMSTDSYVISPLFFPGGNIGSLAVHGTINDIAMAGAKPLYLAVSFILEEGYPFIDLKKIVDAMAKAAHDAEVAIVTGDTKVVEKHKGDGVFITSTGIGIVPDHIHLSTQKIQAGDRILINGPIGDHGIAVMSHRENVQFTTSIESDTAPLHDLVATMLKAAPNLRCLRDPTRGGLATTLNEWAQQSHWGFVIEEDSIPIHEQVQGACELLGLDPLYIANEGKLAAVCPQEEASQLLKAVQQHPLGQQAAIIGEVIEDPHHFVQLKTNFGGRRIVEQLSGEVLPRIC